MTNLEIEEINKSNCERTYRVNDVNVKLWTICSGTLATRINEGYNTKRYNKIPEDKSTMDSPKLDWIEDFQSFKNWFVRETIIKETRDNRENLTYKKAFLTDNKSILIVDVNVNQYISITGDEIAPITEERAKELNNYVLEDLAYDMKENEFQDYKDTYQDTLEFFDNSLYIESFQHNNKYYYYDSVACGCLHNQIKQVSNKFNRLIELHLNKDQSSYKEAINIISKLMAKNQNYDLDQDIQKKALAILGG